MKFANSEEMIARIIDKYGPPGISTFITSVDDASILLWKFTDHSILATVDTFSYDEAAGLVIKFSDFKKM